MKLLKLFFHTAILTLLVSFQADGADKPNVVMFLVDDMGWMDCGAYGSQYYETPHIDRFAREGMLFTRAYAVSLCSPTRASILTGQYASRHGVTGASGHQPPQKGSLTPFRKPGRLAKLAYPSSDTYLDPVHYTLAEALRDAGYKTAHIGKWHLGLTKPHRPEQYGFDVAWHCSPDPGPPGKYFSPYEVVPDGEPTAKNRVGNITDGPPGEYIVDRQADEAVKFIQSNKDGPFFLNLSCYGVHGPWGHKVEYTKYFAEKKDPRGFQGNPIMASMLKSVDDSFGRILDELDKLGLTDNTIIIFYSDNGGNVHSKVPDNDKWGCDRFPTDNSPLRKGKGSLYEGGTRVPLIVRWPGKIKAATTSDEVVGCIDMYPTILDLIKVKAPTNQFFDGISFAPVLKQTGKLNRNAYFTWFLFPTPAGGASVHQGDWKLIRWFEEEPEEPERYKGTHREGFYGLFNLKNDISERNNLAAQMPEKVKELDALIDQFLKETGALYPYPNPDYSPGKGKQ